MTDSLTPVAAVAQLVRDLDRLIVGAAPYLPAWKLHGLQMVRDETEQYHRQLAEPESSLLAKYVRSHGARISYSDEIKMWRVLDQPDTPLWLALFATEDDAAQAYCWQHDLEHP